MNVGINVQIHIFKRYQIRHKLVNMYLTVVKSVTREKSVVLFV